MSPTPIDAPYNHNLEPLERLLANVERPGDFFVQGALEAPMPRIEVDGVGVLSFPVPSSQARKVVAQCERAPYGRGEDTVLKVSGWYHCFCNNKCAADDRIIWQRKLCRGPMTSCGESSRMTFDDGSDRSHGAETRSTRMAVSATIEVRSGAPAKEMAVALRTALNQA